MGRLFGKKTCEKKQCTVGAGHAPPATQYYNEYNGLACRGGYYAARCSRPGYYNITGKPHGTVKTVPYKPAENTASSRNIATNKSLRGRGGACPARGFTVITTLRVNRPKGFPLWGKLSPKVTDEGATAGHLPLIRRVPRHLPPKGKAYARLHNKKPPPLRGDGSGSHTFAYAKSGIKQCPGSS